MELDFKKIYESMNRKQREYKNIALRFDMDLYRKAQQIIGKGNMSKFINAVFKQVVALEVKVSDEEVNYQMLKAMYDAFVSLRNAKLQELQMLEKVIAGIEDLLKQSEQIVQAIRTQGTREAEDRIREIFAQLRVIALQCNFDSLCFSQKAHGYLFELKQFGFEIDEKWIKRYLLRLRVLL